MEQEATVARATKNGIEKQAPVPASEPAHADSIALSKLLDKREKLVQGLNSSKAQLEIAEQRVEDFKTSISRTEGAIFITESYITEIDPEVLQRMAGG